MKQYKKGLHKQDDENPFSRIDARIEAMEKRSAKRKRGLPLNPYTLLSIIIILLFYFWMIKR